MKSNNEVALDKMLFDIQELGGFALMELNGVDTESLADTIQDLKQQVDMENSYDYNR